MLKNSSLGVLIARYYEVFQFAWKSRHFDHKELAAIFSRGQNAVEDFENKFAAKFKAKYGAAFLYGRSGLYALLKSLGLKNCEVIMPAYTCVVVANAVVYSGNIPVCSGRFCRYSAWCSGLNLSALMHSLEHWVSQKAIHGDTIIISKFIFGKKS